MNMTEKVAAHIVSTGYDQLDSTTVSRVKTRLLDSFGVIAAGVHAPCCDELLSLLKGYGRSGQASVFIYGDSLPALDAAFMNSFMMRSYDFEAIEAEGQNKTSTAAHISGTTVPTALAVAEQTKASGKDLITALALGDDFAARLGSATGFDVYGGWDNTGTINGFGATAIAGKLLGLDPVKMNFAFGLILNQLCGTIENINDKTLAFKLPMALTARNSVFSAEFAQLGMTAAKDALQGSKAYFHIYGSDKSNPDLILADLGEKFYGDCVIKPWAACRATHPSIDASMQIIEAHNPDPSQIEKIIIHVTPRTAAGFVGQPFVIGDDHQVCGAFSIRFTAANAFLRKSVRPEHYALEKMQEKPLWDLLEKITIEPSLPPDEYQTANVDVVLAGGETLSARCDVPKGDIYKNPMTDDAIKEKYYANVAVSGVITKEKAKEAEEMIAHLEDLKDISQLIALFANRA
jgi:2-methylcitrate dehydratase PrpD